MGLEDKLNIESKGLLTRISNKIKDSITAKVLAYGLAGSLALGGYGLSGCKGNKKENMEGATIVAASSSTDSSGYVEIPSQGGLPGVSGYITDTNNNSVGGLKVDYYNDGKGFIIFVHDPNSNSLPLAYFGSNETLESIAAQAPASIFSPVLQQRIDNASIATPLWAYFHVPSEGLKYIPPVLKIAYVVTGNPMIEIAGKVSSVVSGTNSTARLVPSIASEAEKITTDVVMHPIEYFNKSALNGGLYIGRYSLSNMSDALSSGSAVLTIATVAQPEIAPVTVPITFVAAGVNFGINIANDLGIIDADKILFDCYTITIFPPTIFCKPTDLIANFNIPPNATITIPPNNMALADTGNHINLEGSAYDIEDGPIVATNLAWTSLCDGNLGTGSSITPLLSPNCYGDWWDASSLITQQTVGTVLLTATDSQGAKGYDCRIVKLYCLDLDGDLHNDVACGGDDCNYTNGWVYPNAPEVCDLIDNQCPGDAGYGSIDEGCGCPGIVNFPDPNLEAAIRNTIAKPTGDIYGSDLIGMNLLSATNINISNLSGLECAVNLSNLELNINQITDIFPLSGLTNLNFLALHNNQITNISPLSSLINLIYIGLVGNPITDISPLLGLTNLNTLWLGYNQITDISLLSGLTNLKILYLYNNQITNISPLSGLTNLTKLQLGYNQITDISPLSGLTKLIELGLHNNQISNISLLSGLTNLNYLSLGSNQITDISPLSGLTKLIELYLYNNQISNISLLSGLTNLNFLSLHGNQITDVQALVDNLGIGSGDTVYLNNNPLSITACQNQIPILINRGVTVYHTCPP